MSSFTATEDTTGTEPEGALDFKAMRAELDGLWEPRPSVYWIDFLVCVGLGWSCFFTTLVWPQFWALTAVLIAVAVFALYRALAFIHELAHLRRGAVPGFRFAWNVLCGIPLLVPDFLYGEIHRDHHNKRDYGTVRDAEYLPFVRSGRLTILAQVPVVLALPLLSLVRFSIIGPLSFLLPGARRFVERRMSSVVMRFEYQRPQKTKAREKRNWLVQEAACSLFAISLAASLFGWGMEPHVLLYWYVVAAGIGVLNLIRTLGATHCYRSDETSRSFPFQISDSVSVDSGTVDNLLICPVGLRFHSLHHLFQSLPYHSLAEAHDRLKQSPHRFPDYCATHVGSVWVGIASLWIESSRPGQAPVPSGMAVRKQGMSSDLTPRSHPT